MEHYKIDGNKDLARDPQTNAIVNVNDSDYKQYISVRRTKTQKDKVIDDLEGELTTPLINNRECAFVVDENGISKCAIEKAYTDKKIEFKKPISCHLFPIRIKEYRDFDAVNYEKIKICKPACECGSKLEVPLYVFLKEALIRKYGENWYKGLLDASKLLKD